VRASHRPAAHIVSGCGVAPAGHFIVTPHNWRPPVPTTVVGAPHWPGAQHIAHVQGSPFEHGLKFEFGAFTLQ
jgi:hypothetical protein